MDGWYDEIVAVGMIGAGGLSKGFVAMMPGFAIVAIRLLSSALEGSNSGKD